MEAIQIIQFSPSQLTELVTNAVAVGVTEGIKQSNKQHQDAPEHYSKREAAYKCGKSIPWIDSQRRLSKLKWFRVGGTVRIPASEIDRLLKDLDS